MKKIIILFISIFLAFNIPGYNQTYYYQSGDTVSKNGQAYTSAIMDTSGVKVTNRGVFILGHSSVRTTGNASNTDNSSKYGINAGVLSKLGSWIRFTADTVATAGTGANGLFATDSASKITMTGGSITTGNSLAHGVDVSYGGSVSLTNVNVTTNGLNSPALATGFNGGTVDVSGGTIIAASTTSGSQSAGIYSTGTITVADATVSSAGDNGAVIDVSGSISLTNTNLTGAKNGLMMHNTGTGSAIGSFTMNGGSLTASGGDAFYSTGTTGTVSLSGAASITASSGNIVNVVSSAITNFSASGEHLTGNFISDNTSSFSILLSDSTDLTGSINASNASKLVTLTMDATSMWNLTALSYVPVFFDQPGIVNDSAVNVSGNGFNVIYDETNKKNAYLKAYKYKLRNGGLLTCPTCVEGVSETTNSVAVKYSPNPAAAQLNILIGDPLSQKIIVFNTLGVRVHEFNVERQTTIDVSDWENGLYFFRVNNSTERVIVMH